MNDPHTVHTIKRLLDQSAQQISPHIQARLNQSIAAALAVHAKKHGCQAGQRNTAWAGMANKALQQVRSLAALLNRPAFSMALSVACILFAAIGVVQVASIHYDNKATETADLEAAILVDDLPPDAYLDRGFIEFSNQHPKNNPLPNDDSLDEWLRTLNSGEQPNTSI